MEDLMNPGRDPASVYRTHEGKVVIDLILHSRLQLFNSLDPAPFFEKELDPAAEDYIYSAIDDLPNAQPVEMVVYLPADVINEDLKQMIPSAVRNHFLYKSAQTDRELRRLFRRGRTVLLIGAAILLVCLFTRQIILAGPNMLIPHVIAEAFVIFAWIAMWEPGQIFLYSWWPIVRKKRIFEKAAEMDVVVRPAQLAGDGGHIPRTPSG
jgi:hypothetical protein